MGEDGKGEEGRREGRKQKMNRKRKPQWKRGNEVVSTTFETKVMLQHRVQYPWIGTVSSTREETPALDYSHVRYTILMAGVMHQQIRLELAVTGEA
jgi:hypothetical protein